MSEEFDINKVFAELSKDMMKGAIEPVKSGVTKIVASLSNYEPYLRETYKKVSTFRSLVNPNLDVDTATHYVHADFSPAHAKTPDLSLEELINTLAEPKRYIISGHAGFGKSMALRYIALSLFEKPIGKIPIFIELRRLNNLTAPNLLKYINLTYASSGKVAQKVFDDALNRGVFVFLLDGFDEISHEIRDSVEAQIKSIASQFAKNTLIISGRPSEGKYSSWSNFEMLKLKPMSKAKVKELIKKLDYDDGVKKRFLLKMDSIYDRHQSFLSTPLLAILMLMTYQKNATIPEKMYIFYGRAFETLFNQHDAIKEQYERPRLTALQIDELSAIFSVFCFSTYVKEKFEFSRSEISSFLRDAVKYQGADVDVGSLISDLQESVCLIMNEGGEYFFVHRSFQEYFAALFLSSCSEEIRNQFLNGQNVRAWDEVLPMLFDMAGDQIAAGWLPEQAKKLEVIGNRSGAVAPVYALHGEVYFSRRNNEIDVWHIGWGPFGSLCNKLRSLLSLRPSNKLVNRDEIAEFVKSEIDHILSISSPVAVDNVDPDEENFCFAIEEIPIDVLRASNLVASANETFDILKRSMKSIDVARNMQADYMADVLSAKRRR